MEDLQEDKRKPKKTKKLDNECYLRNRGVRKHEEEGMGLLKVYSPNFLEMRKECSEEFKRLQKKFKTTM